MIEQGALTINGIQDIAATTIQKCWRGYAVRKAFTNRKPLLIEHDEKLKGKKRASAAEQMRTGDLFGNQTPRSVSPRYFKPFDICKFFRVFQCFLLHVRLRVFVRCVFLHVFQCVFCVLFYVFQWVFLCVFHCVFLHLFQCVVCSSACFCVLFCVFQCVLVRSSLFEEQ